MKKLILVLFLCLSCLSFAKWKTIDITDDFGNKTGTSMIGISENKECFISMRNLKEITGSEGSAISIHFRDNKFYDSTVLAIKIKIDDLAPLEFRDSNIPNGNSVLLMIYDDLPLIDLLKKGKTMKIAITKLNGLNGEVILEEFTLKGFPKAFSKAYGK